MTSKDTKSKPPTTTRFGQIVIGPPGKDVQAFTLGGGGKVIILRMKHYCEFVR